MVGGMQIPTEGVGSVPRPQYLIDAAAALQRSAIALDGVTIPFEDGHTRQLPRLTAGPFRDSGYTGRYVTQARQHTKLPLKQAVIAASAMSLLYPEAGIEGYSREQFLEDLVSEAADVDYAELLPDLFQMNAGRFYLQMASETDRPRVLDIIRRERKPGQTTFIGVIDPCDVEVESLQTVRDRTLEAAEFLQGERFGTTDDCGFSPFSDDVAMARATAFAKIKARVDGTRMAAEALDG